MEWLRQSIGLAGTVALVGALITAFGAVVATIDQNRKERQLRERADEIASLNRDLTAKANEIAGLNRRIAELVTGTGELSISFGIEERIFEGKPHTFALLAVVNETALPAYDVVLNGVDVLQTQELKRRFPENVAARLVLEGLFQKNLGTVAKQQAVVLTRNPLQLPDVTVEALHEFRLTTREGVISQIVRFMKVGGVWTYATRAIRQSDSVVVYQHIEGVYPDPAMAGSDWWSRPLQ